MPRQRVLLRLALLIALAVAIYFIAQHFLLRPYAATEPIAIDALPARATFERAFPNLEFARPVGLTFPPDGTNRIVVISQYGSLYIFPNDANVEEATELLNMRHKVMFRDPSNEEGLLGLAFHPQFRTNRQLFLYYTNAAHQNVLSRFTMSAKDPNRADPNSEEELFHTPERDSWNHNGGTIIFGPDGYLYMALGDGGPVSDPHGNGQNAGTVFGKILRIDVDHRDDDGHGQGLKYAIPNDNPFVGQPGVRGEIWALGLRNVWRMAFDRQTNRLWAGEIGDDTWEEINVIERGGNYQWSMNEGFGKFVPSQGSPAPPPAKIIGNLTDPIFAYNHTVGNCIIGGCVYRGKAVPELFGAYLFADHVTGQLYAMRFDEPNVRAKSVSRIEPRTMPIFSFGEDEQGEVYFTTAQGIINRFKTP
ncbi:MAG: PQQ-dependent sugar dehydrogenase [Planctomycetia bacterium]|nr:PQQ-dependent sugar dehydrogenase [Planctomycetia bacterium]